MDSKKNGKRKRHYRAMAYGNKKNKLSAGKNVIQESLQGFIIVCNGKEKEAIREAYRLLNETHRPEDQADSSDVDDGNESIESAMAKEKAKLSSSEDSKDFQLVYTAGVSNFMFLKSLPDPLPLANKIMDSILQDGKQRTRFLIRLVPIQTVCKAYTESIHTAITGLLQTMNLGENITYCVAFKSRFNNNLGQVDAVQAVNTAVSESGKEWSVQLKGSDYVIVLEVVTSYCCIGILPQYQQRKKYNLIELAKSVAQDDTKFEAVQSALKDSSEKTPELLNADDNGQNEAPIKDNALASRGDNPKEGQAPGTKPVNNQEETQNIDEKVSISSDVNPNEGENLDSKQVDSKPDQAEAS
uniref:THUMP domain-containing protein 1 n=1 Tax=Caligus rogercresseyi TaxID=217165 RepID=C1BN31_CALRO|nr:THUMP domain-containing protein 1 [Caligus rogercresseyi]